MFLILTINNGLLIISLLFSFPCFYKKRNYFSLLFIALHALIHLCTCQRTIRCLKSAFWQKRNKSKLSVWHTRNMSSVKQSPPSWTEQNTGPCLLLHLYPVLIFWIKAIPKYLCFSGSTLSYLISRLFITHALDLPSMSFPISFAWWDPNHFSRASSKASSVKASQTTQKSIHHQFFLCIVSCALIVIFKFYIFFHTLLCFLTGGLSWSFIPRTYCSTCLYNRLSLSVNGWAGEYDSIFPLDPNKIL